ncbi:MAG: sigma-70 family RNA polymerase sigma factor [Nitrospirae bacterium]|nr:sigma-70 family RNA polymerase sigma factor [Nitrospirota bacterium]
MSDGTNPPARLSYSTGQSSSSVSDDDAALVSSAQKGDLRAFEQLVTKHQKKMLNIAYRLIGDHDDACEVVQDAFVSAYKNIRRFRGDAKFTTWLTTITLNLSKNRLKQVRSRQGHEAFSLNDPIQTDDGTMTMDPPSKEPSVLERMERRAVQTRMRDCIKALDADFREILVLRDMQEFSYEEIGSMLKVREGTVKSRLFRARDMVKDCLKRFMGEL